MSTYNYTFTCLSLGRASWKFNGDESLNNTVVYTDVAKSHYTLTIVNETALNIGTYECKGYDIIRVFYATGELHVEGN